MMFRQPVSMSQYATMQTFCKFQEFKNWTLGTQKWSSQCGKRDCPVLKTSMCFHLSCLLFSSNSPFLQDHFRFSTILMAAQGEVRENCDPQ